jgi:hypothetical protein
MSWKSIFGSELNLSFIELALALAGSSSPHALCRFVILRLQFF